MNELVTNVTADDSCAARLALKMRRKMYAVLDRSVQLDSISSILDVGVTADRMRVDSNFFEQLYPHPERITAVSDQDAAWLEQVYPGLTFVRGDGCRLDFPDSSFDLVFSSAVLEHVGSAERQKAFLAESFRVTRKYLFMTTPSRWYPIEFHTALPLLHWLPKPLHRKVLTLLNRSEFASEATLNLLSRKDLACFCEDLGIQKYVVKSVKLLGFSSNLLLIAEKA